MNRLPLIEGTVQECRYCMRWLARIETRYEDGSVVANWENAEGKGRCNGPLKGALTEPDFGCNKFAPGGPISESHYKAGAPWQHKKLGPCPDCKHEYCGYPDCTYAKCPGGENCKGVGGRINIPRNGIGEANVGMDNHCHGTGQVFYYDDGFIGENKTKMHPMEKQHGKQHDAPTPTCYNCRKSIDLNWIACPYCGTRLKQEERLSIGEASGTVVAPPPEAAGTVVNGEGASQ